jgi:hypothetical protein
MAKDALRKQILKHGAKKGPKKVKDFLDITPSKRLVKVLIKILKTLVKTLVTLGENFIKTTGKLVKNKTVGTGAVAAGTSAVVSSTND